MKKTFLTAILAIVCTLCLCFGLAACGSVGTEQGGTEQGGTEQGGTEQGGTEQGGTEQGGTEQGGTEQGGTEQGGTEQGGTEQGGTEQPKEYTVTFDANGGAFSDGTALNVYITVKENAKLTAPLSPTRDNYTFAGWTKTKDGSDLWQFGEDAVTSNVTLWAKWTQESAVLFSVDGASIEGTEVFLYVEAGTEEVNLTGGKVVCSADSTWHLYRKGSESEIYTKTASALADGNNEFRIVVASKDGENVNTYNFTIHRSYEATITYYDGESVLETATCYTGQSFTADYEPEITGYTFNKWTTAENEDFTSAVIWEPISLYVDKTANTYRVTFDSAGGSDVNEKTVTFDQSYAFPSSARTGYTFLGWWTEDIQLTDGSSSLLPLWNIDSDTEVTAHWQANEYTLTLNRNDNNAGTVSGGGDYAYDSQVTIRARTNNGYNFLGWYDMYDALVSDQAQYTFKMGLSVSYTAKWDYYTLTTSLSNINAGTISQSYNNTKVSVGTVVTITATTNMGYTWVGWYKGEDEVSTEPSYQITMGKENVTYEARWELVAGMEKFNFTSTPETCTITGLKDTTAAEIIIPDCVTMIGYRAFYGCSGLESVTIGNGVTEIGGYAFYGCSGLMGELMIPDSVTSIDTDAFYGCSGLTSVTIGNGVTEIMFSAFAGCSELESVIWDAENCTSAGSENSTIFKGCVKLRTVTFGDMVKTIPAYAFYARNELTSIEIPNSVTSIGNEAFNYCRKLVEVWDHSGLGIQKGLSENGYIAYYAKYVYTGDEVSKQTVTDGGYIFYEDAFYNCSGLMEVKILGSGATSIGTYAFQACTLLESVTIGDGVTSIGSSAFYHCSGLESVTIGSGVTSIGGSAFYNCRSLEAVYYKGTPSGWGRIKIGNDINELTGATRYYYSDEKPTAEQWQESENWWHYDEDGSTIVLWTKEEA